MGSKGNLDERGLAREVRERGRERERGESPGGVSRIVGETDGEGSSNRTATFASTMLVAEGTDVCGESGCEVLSNVMFRDAQSINGF